MQVRVTDVKKWIGREQSVHLTEPWPNLLEERLEGILSGPAEIDVRIRNLGRSLIVELQGSAEVWTDCVRCLRPTKVVIPYSALEEFRDEAGPSDPFLDYFRYTNDSIELDEIVSDLVAVSMPIAPVCSGDCKGLCPQCGMNLNESQCLCTPESDSRWEILRNWDPKDS